MKVKAERNACNPEGDDHSCFVLTWACCPRLQDEFMSVGGRGLYRFLNDDDTLCWGEFGEYLIDDVRYCPYCGQEVEVEREPTAE